VAAEVVEMAALESLRLAETAASFFFGLRGTNHEIRMD
jgi:hypothetical protein